MQVRPEADAPRRLAPDDPALPDVLALIQQSFAFMDARIDPPSSMHRLRVEDLSASCATGEVWAIGAPLRACVVLTPKPDCLYLGKLAVAERARGAGLARRLVEWAALRACDRGYAWLELQVRVELVENLRAFAAMGFVETARTAHPGFDRPTSVTMRRACQR